MLTQESDQLRGSCTTGSQDIPAGAQGILHTPKLSIREQMAAYKEIIDGSALDAAKRHMHSEDMRSVIVLRDTLSQSKEVV